MDIRKVKTLDDVLRYFAENLHWNIVVDDFFDIDDYVFDYCAEDLGLKDEVFAKISALKQLRPIATNQKWGIFCVEFEGSRFEVTALRKILSALVPNQRNAQNHAVWDQQDLLFICFWGKDNDRTIGIAHFEDKDNGLPQIKMFYCAPALEDFTQIKHFEDKLACLTWPKVEADTEKWESDWSEAFDTAYHQVISDSSTLTEKLAEEAQHIRDRVLSIFSVETSTGYVHLLFEKFKNTLIHDMNEQAFADMYAQTIVYGLFSARCMDQTQENFDILEAIECIPNTNPFLRSLLKECFTMQSTNLLSFDELEIGNVVELLKHTNTESIITDFNRQTGGGKEDPIIHFYEEFLTKYDKVQKIQRGVFYTPQPVVNFIINAVDSIIKNDFGLPNGLASIETKKIKTLQTIHYKSKPDKIKESIISVPAIQILDPATGTGTFIRQTILQIYENFKDSHKDLDKNSFISKWNKYVDESLLPRINGFEIMMAPYAVAHMKLAMVLKDTGYTFSADSRLKIFLTNSLEEAGNSNFQISMFEDILACESVAANAVKKNNGINIVIGNPPYSGISSNNNNWINEKVNDYKYTNGIYFNERKHWLNDDYVKFIRYAQYISDNSESSIIAYITPHGYIDNPTFRSMRWNLLESFNCIYILNLHGNINRKEKSPDGSKDENVFDIQQGVAISIFIKRKYKSKCKVYYSDLYGARNKKYEFLTSKKINDISWEEIYPSSDFYLFKPSLASVSDSYENGFKITDLFNSYTAGIITARDGLTIDFDKNTLLDKISYFANPSFSDEDIRNTFWPNKVSAKYPVGDSRGWSLSECRQKLIGNINPNVVRAITYRPFDFRYIYYSADLVDWGRESILGNLVPPNIAIISARSNKSGRCDHFYITENLAEAKCGESTTQSTVFPLYVSDVESDFSIPNLNGDIINRISLCMNASYEMRNDSNGRDKTFGPYDIIYYIYAIMNSTKYRSMYQDKLSMDFPIIPYPRSFEYFSIMRRLGYELKQLHLAQQAMHIDTNYDIKNGSNIIERYTYDIHTHSISINNNQHFDDISENEWEFSIGGYKPLQKWLKDRKGVVLEESDILHYEKMIFSIRRSIIIMNSIDNIY